MELIPDGEKKMLMTDVQIREAFETGELVIDQFDEGSLQGASYDSRGGEKGRYFPWRAHRTLIDMFQQTKQDQTMSAEFIYRYNNRVSQGVDGFRPTETALAGVKGKRLMYQATI